MQRKRLRLKIQHRIRRLRDCCIRENNEQAQAVASNTGDYRWWDRLAFIIDNSKSMAGQRIDAIKEVLQNEVDDLFNERPKGVEVRLETFNNTSSTNQLIL